ncbi:MAG: amidohydrolase [Ignavibacteria bacterium]|nr:amidohydrolase [Ignavibacteria bacterium]
MTTLEQVRALFPQMVETRRHIHRHPELSFHEFETSKFISQQLSDMGIEHSTIATTGIVAHIGSGSRCVALRADIDALPIVEETGLEYASQNPGVMHACGHDTHTTMLLTTARVLKANESSLNGVVKLLFQPGEEKTPGGASIMIEQGALQNPTPEIIFGQHIDPDATFGNVSFVAGPMLASADELYWTIKGFGAHAAQPHKGKDPIMAATGLVQHLQNLVTKNRNPLLPGVMTITSIHGGSATNIIPDVVEMKGTLRSFDAQWRKDAWTYLEEQTRLYCALHGCEGTIEIHKGYPPLVNDAGAVDFAREVAATVLDASKISDFEPKMWAEDFSFYTEHMPACFWMLGGRPAALETMPGLHNPRFAPEEEAMITGAALLVETATQYLNKV